MRTAAYSRASMTRLSWAPLGARRSWRGHESNHIPSVRQNNQDEPHAEDGFFTKDDNKNNEKKGKETNVVHIVEFISTNQTGAC